MQINKTMFDIGEVKYFELNENEKMAIVRHVAELLYNHIKSTRTYGVHRHEQMIFLIDEAIELFVEKEDYETAGIINDVKKLVNAQNS